MLFFLSFRDQRRLGLLKIEFEFVLQLELVNLNFDFIDLEMVFCDFCYSLFFCVFKFVGEYI